MTTSSVVMMGRTLPARARGLRAVFVTAMIQTILTQAVRATDATVNRCLGFTDGVKIGVRRSGMGVRHDRICDQSHHHKEGNKNTLHRWQPNDKQLTCPGGRSTNSQLDAKRLKPRRLRAE